MNFCTDVIEIVPGDRLAMIELSASGCRREWTFGAVSAHVAALAGCFERAGIGKGDVVMTVIGNRSEWVLSLCACFRIGAIVLPCAEQLRAKDLRLRMDVVSPSLIIFDPRNLAAVQAAQPTCPVLSAGDLAMFSGPSADAVDLDPDDPCLITFTSGTSGPPKAAVHAQRYLRGQELQATHWLDARAGDLVWCTASSGWSKSARNAFIAPWLNGAAALIHDGRFDSDERLAIVEHESVNVLCMSPTEYRIIAKRTQLRPLPSLRSLVAAGEALDLHTLKRWRDAVGVDVRDGYGQTETGQLTGTLPGVVRPGSMGRALPGVELWIDNGELVLAPGTDPTFFLGYLGDEPRGHDEPWRTGDLVRQDEDGFFYFVGRADDVIISSGYRIGPFEVESALVTHPAVADAAVIAADDQERGSIVHALVVLQPEYEPSDDLRLELQRHVMSQTAPYKYPRVLEFVVELPKTASGKIKRAELRQVVSHARRRQY